MDLLSRGGRTTPPGTPEGQAMAQQPKAPATGSQTEQELNPEAEKASAIGKVLSAVGKALAQPEVPEMLAGMGIAFGTSPSGIKSAGARVGEQFLETRALSRDIETRKAAEVLAGRRTDAIVTTAGAAALKAETFAETEPLKTEAIVTRAEAYKREIDLASGTVAEKEEQRLAAQRESREFGGLKRNVNDLTLEKEAYESNQAFFKKIGKGGIPESIPVSWTPEKARELNYLLALGEAGYNVDLALYPPETDEQTEIFIQSVIDQGVSEGLTPEEAETAAFDSLFEIRNIK